MGEDLIYDEYKWATDLIRRCHSRGNMRALIPSISELKSTTGETSCCHKLMEIRFAYELEQITNKLIHRL